MHEDIETPRGEVTDQNSSAINGVTQIDFGPLVCFSFHFIIETVRLTLLLENQLKV